MTSSDPNPALMTLFQLGQFQLHSGAESDFKIDCDALTDEDINTLATLGARLLAPFRRVEGVPRGGLRLAEAMKAHRSKTGGLLIVDDVLTTGTSMNEQRRYRSARGFVIFARAEPPRWITPLFRMVRFD